MSGHPGLTRHALCTPLNHVIGYADLVAARLEPGRQKSLTQLLRMAGQLVQQVDVAANSSDGSHVSLAMAKALSRDAITLLDMALSVAGSAQDGPARPVSEEPTVDDDLRVMVRSARALVALLAQTDEATTADSPTSLTSPPGPSRVGGAQLTSRARYSAAVSSTAGYILVADDDIDNRRLLERLLTDDGHTVIAVADGEQALAAVSTHAIDIVLLDVHMPGLDGHAVLRRLKADPVHKVLPVLLISADQERTVAVRGIELGATDILPKPVDVTILRARIARCLENKRWRVREMTLQQQRSAMLASISHDLRQPLQAVRLYADAVAARVTDAGVHELLQRHQWAAQAAVDMLDQFGDIAAIEQGALTVRRQRFDLRALLLDLAARLNPKHLLAESSVELVVRGREVWVTSDRTLCGRILQNLVSNALRCTARSSQSARPRVLLSLRRLAGMPCVDVIDNGPGIAPADLEAIFLPYVQRKDSGSRGLGLSIVRGLSEELGLVLHDVRSRLGHGTRFRVQWPEAQGCASATTEEGPRTLALADTGPVAGQLLALIDDDPAALHALSAALTGAGARCVMATEASALERLLDEEIRLPDALVFDVDLGSDLSGFDVADRLCADWDHPYVAVFVSGRDFVLPPHWQRARQLRKPLRLDELMSALVVDHAEGHHALSGT